MLPNRPIPRARSRQVTPRDTSEPLSLGRQSARFWPMERATIIPHTIGYPAYGYPIYRPYAATYGVGSYYNPYTGAYGAGRGVYGPYRGAAAGACIQSLHRDLRPWGNSVWSIRKPERGAGIQSLHRDLRRHQTRFERRMVRGASPSYPRETDRPIPSIFRLRTVLSQRSRAQKAEPQLALRPSTGTPPWRKPPAVTCMPRHDGNVYKNTGTGWSKYDNGNWNPVQQSSKDAQERAQSAAGSKLGAGNQAAAQQRAQNRQGFQHSARSQSQGGFNRAGSSGFGDVDRDFQDRNRGEFQSQRFDSFQRGGGGWGGSERGGGAVGGFGGRRR